MYHDFVIQIKNAALARKKELVTPYSNINKGIAKVLLKEGFLSEVKEEIIDGRKHLHITLRYQRRKPAITNLSLISKPSLRVYIGSDKVLAKQRHTTAVLSTNTGILSGKEAAKKGVGGELLFNIW